MSKIYTDLTPYEHIYSPEGRTDRHAGRQTNKQIHRTINYSL